MGRLQSCSPFSNLVKEHYAFFCLTCLTATFKFCLFSPAHHLMLGHITMHKIFLLLVFSFAGTAFANLVGAGETGFPGEFFDMARGRA